MSPTVHHEEHEAYVNVNGTCQLAVEEYIAGERVPVAIEGQSKQFAFAIEDR